VYISATCPYKVKSSTWQMPFSTRPRAGRCLSKMELSRTLCEDVQIRSKHQQAGSARCLSKMDQ